MNKKLFLKLGLFLLSLSLVSCGQKNNSLGEDNSSKVSTSQSVSSTQSSEEESIKITSPSDENSAESKEKDEDVQKNTQPDVQQDTQQESTEDEYYRIIKEAWQKQKDYIDSIADSKEKQSVQTSQSAAIMESNRLLIEHPEDSEAIDVSLKRVINDD